MDRVTSLYKALDILTILGGSPHGYRASELAFIMHLPRSTAIRVLNSLVEYGLVTKEGAKYMATEAFAQWAQKDRHARLIARYRPVLERVHRFCGELVLTSVLQGNGIVHLDYIEQDGRVPVAPAPATHHAIRHSAVGKLILSQRPDLAERWIAKEPAFADELDGIRKTGVAWNDGETVAEMVAMATHGFTTAQTDAKVVVAWPRERFNTNKALRVLKCIRSELATAAALEQDARI